MFSNNIEVVFSEKEIAERVSQLAYKISSDYVNSKLLVIGILNGSFIFLADLTRCISIPIEIDFISVASYGSSTISSENVEFKLGLKTDVLEKHILIVEDIIDTGYSLHKSDVINHFIKSGAKSVKICALLNKESRRKVPIAIDYLGFDIPDIFVVGYGMDYAGLYRNLPYIGIINE